MKREGGGVYWLARFVGEAESGLEFDVFLSYHSGDAEWVAKLKAALCEKGLKVWIDADEIRPGDRFAEALEHGLRSSRSVVLVVSAGSLQSNWVKEEYYNALSLANAWGRGLRIIPALIESVGVPGFLSTRSRVDFRDPAAFEANVERLCFGITGARGQAKEPEQEAAPEPASGGIDELTYLERALAREERNAASLARVRWVSPLAGLAAPLLGFLLNANSAAETLAIEAVGGSLVTGLIGWAATAGALSAARLNVTRLTYLRDGLDLCRRKREDTGCPVLWKEFWRVAHRNAGIDTA